MILGRYHWLHETDLKERLPAEIWVLIFEFVFQSKQADLKRLFTRGEHQSEENIIDFYDEDTPYMQSFVHNNRLVQTHFHRIITFEFREMASKHFFYTVGKINALKRLIEHAKCSIVKRWHEQRLRMYKKDLFVTHIISYTCVYDLLVNERDPGYLVGIYHDYVWSDKRGQHYRVY